MHKMRQSKDPSFDCCDAKLPKTSGMYQSSIMILSSDKSLQKNSDSRASIKRRSPTVCSCSSCCNALLPPLSVAAADECKGTEAVDRCKPLLVCIEHSGASDWGMHPCNATTRQECLVDCQPCAPCNWHSVHNCTFLSLHPLQGLWMRERSAK